MLSRPLPNVSIDNLYVRNFSLHCQGPAIRYYWNNLLKIANILCADFLRNSGYSRISAAIFMFFWLPQILSGTFFVIFLFCISFLASMWKPLFLIRNHFSSRNNDFFSSSTARQERCTFNAPIFNWQLLVRVEWHLQMTLTVSRFGYFRAYSKSLNDEGMQSSI